MLCQYKYYIEMERIIHKFLEKTLENNRNEIENKNNEMEQLQKELNDLKFKTYEEKPMNGFVYIMRVGTSETYKIGKSIKPDNRCKSLQTANVEKITVLFKYETCDDALLEHIMHNILKKDYNVNKEFFQCNLDYLKLLIENVGNIIHIFKCTKQFITNEELCKRLLNENIKQLLKSITIEEIIKFIKEPSNALLNKKNVDIYLQFLNECTEYADTHISTAELYEYFKIFYKNIESDMPPKLMVFIANLKRLKIEQNKSVRVLNKINPTNGFKNLKLKK